MIEISNLCLSCQGHSVTKLGLPETKLGIIPGAGGTQRATRILGLSKAKDLIFTGRSLTAAEAEELGMRSFLYPRCVTPTPTILRTGRLCIGERYIGHGPCVVPCRGNCCEWCAHLVAHDCHESLIWLPKHLSPCVRQSWRYHELRNSR
jgi:hypothetical protein